MIVGFTVRFFKVDVPVSHVIRWQNKWVKVQYRC